MTTNPNKNMDTKTTISGSGKNLEGIEWSNLLAGYCPKCDSDIRPDGNYFICDKCSFVISKTRFNEVCQSMENYKSENL